MNRGSGLGPMTGSEPANGFNEAPIHESGKSEQGRCLPAKQRYRFNEAPIHESGKWHPARGAVWPARRFNEAPIHESGKSGTSISLTWDEPAPLQ